MLVLVVRCQIKPDNVAQFIEASLDDGRHSVTDEPGCVRFDVVQDNEDPTLVWLYEIYQDQAAVDHHVTTPHFHRWKTAVADWFSAPTQVSRCTSRFLAEEA